MTPICQELAVDVKAAHSVLRTSTDLGETLDVIWQVQDQLRKLVMAADDSPGETLSLLAGVYPSLIREIIRLLTMASQGGFSRIDALQQSCASINNSLIELEQIKQRFRYPQHVK